MMCRLTGNSVPLSGNSVPLSGNSVSLDLVCYHLIAAARNRINMNTVHVMWNSHAIGDAPNVRTWYHSLQRKLLKRKITPSQP